MLIFIIKTFWFLLPAGIANMSPVLFKWVPFLNFPVDFNFVYKGEPLFGKNKTYRGFVFGIIMAIFVIYLQTVSYSSFTKEISFIDYSNVNIFLLGFLFGFGALMGDLVKSFFKRRLNIKSGNTWIFFDQVDWIIGSLIFVSFYINISLKQVIISVILFGIIHPIINILGYFLKIKKNKF